MRNTSGCSCRNISDICDTQKLRNIIAHYGIKAQCYKAIEELEELNAELEATLDGDIIIPTPSIVDEIADVLVMASQLREIFGAEAVDERIEFKLNRTIKRMS